MDLYKTRYNMEPNCLDTLGDMTDEDIATIFHTKPIWRVFRFSYKNCPKSILRDNLSYEAALHILKILRENETEINS